MIYTKAWIKEYNKTWYYRISTQYYECPDNWISARVLFSIFGLRIILWKLAKPNYKWNKIN